jgi:hypothetical protein
MLKAACRKRNSGRSRAFNPGWGSGPLIGYALVPAHLPYVNDGRLWVGDRIAPRARRVAAALNCVQGGVDLWFCDARGRSGAVISRPTEKEVRRYAEALYPGLARHWVRRRVSKAVAARYMERLRRENGCSICRRTPEEHGGPQVEAGRVRICGGCIVELYELIGGREGLPEGAAKAAASSRRRSSRSRRS